MRFERTDDEKEIFIRLNGLRALLAITVLFSHIWGYTGLVFLVPFNKAVTIAVYLFFVLSGYGLMRSYQRKKGYIKSIFMLKIPHLIFMAVMAYIVSAFVQMLLGVTEKGEECYLPFGVTSLLRTTNWYVYELMAYYIIFSLVTRISNKYIMIGVIMLCTIAGFVILFHSGLVEAYYNSIFGFVTGAVLGRFDYSDILKHTFSGFMVGGIMLLVSFGLMFVLNKDSMTFALVRNFAGCGAAIFLLYFCRYIKIDNGINRYICKMSPELYFYHMPIAVLFSKVITDPYIYMLLVIAVSFVMAVVFNIFDGFIHERWVKLIRK